MHEPERREHPRMRALKSASVVLENKHSTFDCTIRNISPAGAKLVLESTIGLPDHFFVRLEDGTQKHCEVRWRALKEVGVVFDDMPGKAA